MESMESCMFCLNDCSTYIKFDNHLCKTVSHKKCFEEYVNIINENNKNNENKFIKCIICREIITRYNIFNRYNKYMADIIKNSSLINSLFYSTFFMVQNIYFYIDNKFFYNSDGIFRAIFAVIFHSFLLLLTFFPFFIVIHIKYIYRFVLNLNILRFINNYNMGNKEIYKIYNLR
jgi:hypothetical protein